jgi:hypothetical protein
MTLLPDTIFARLLRRLARAVCKHPRWFVYLKYRQEFPREDELMVVVQSGRRERNR